MEICNGGRDGAAAVSNKDVNAKAFRKHRKVKEWPGTIDTQEAMCVYSPSKRGKENALDQSNDVKYWDAAKQDELMETWSRNAALRAERLILSFPYLRPPLAAEDVGNAFQFLKFSETFRGNSYFCSIIYLIKKVAQNLF
ncbi:hypothetical protein EV2_041119 [Malus domestica]